MKKKIISLAIVALLMLSLAACGGTQGESYTVGIGQLEQHPALDAATLGFKDALSEKLGDSVSFDEQNASGDPATCSVIFNAFVSSRVDLMMANATTALQAALASSNEIPTLGTSVTDYGTALGVDDWSGTSGTNISGTSDLAPLDEQAAMIKEIFPDAEKIGILYCSSEPNSKYQAEVITGYLVEMGYTCKEFTFSDTNDVQAVTTAAAAESDVIFAPTDNTLASNAEILKNVCVPAGVPIIAGEEGICAVAGVATLSIDYYELGWVTGEMAYEILVNGADPATMEVRFAPTVTKKYNPEICEALGISLSDDYIAIEAES